jgi:hypothetical protein
VAQCTTATDRSNHSGYDSRYNHQGPPIGSVSEESSDDVSAFSEDRGRTVMSPHGCRCCQQCEDISAVSEAEFPSTMSTPSEVSFRRNRRKQKQNRDKFFETGSKPMLSINNNKVPGAFQMATCPNAVINITFNIPENCDTESMKVAKKRMDKATFSNGKEHLGDDTSDYDLSEDDQSSSDFLDSDCSHAPKDNDVESSACGCENYDGGLHCGGSFGVVDAEDETERSLLYCPRRGEINSNSMSCRSDYQPLVASISDDSGDDISGVSCEEMSCETSPHCTQIFEAGSNPTINNNNNAVAGACQMATCENAIQNINFHFPENWNTEDISKTIGAVREVLTQMVPKRKDHFDDIASHGMQIKNIFTKGSRQILHCNTTNNFFFHGEVRP